MICLMQLYLFYKGKRYHPHEKLKVSRFVNNKAGYTANTSCGRVGRGGNAQFHTFRLVFMDRPTEGPTNGRTDGRTDGQSLL